MKYLKFKYNNYISELFEYRNITEDVGKIKIFFDQNERWEHFLKSISLSRPRMNIEIYVDDLPRREFKSYVLQQLPTYYFPPKEISITLLLIND